MSVDPPNFNTHTKTLPWNTKNMSTYLYICEKNHSKKLSITTEKYLLMDIIASFSMFTCLYFPIRLEKFCHWQTEVLHTIYVEINSSQQRNLESRTKF